MNVDMLDRPTYLLIVAHKDAVKRAQARVDRVLAEPYDRRALAEALHTLEFEKNELRQAIAETR